VVPAVGQGGQPVAHAPSFAHWMSSTGAFCDRDKAK